MRYLFSFNINPLFSPCNSLSGDTNSSVKPNLSSIFPKIFNLQMCYIHHWKGILNSFCSLYYIKVHGKNGEGITRFFFGGEGFVIFCVILCPYMTFIAIFIVGLILLII